MENRKQYFTIAVYGDDIHYPKNLLLDTRFVYCKARGVKNTAMYHFVVDCVAFNKECVKIFKGIV